MHIQFQHTKDEILGFHTGILLVIYLVVTSSLKTNSNVIFDFAANSHEHQCKEAQRISDTSPEKGP